MRALFLLPLLPFWVLIASIAFCLLTVRLFALGFEAPYSWPVFLWTGIREGFWPGDPLALLGSAVIATGLTGGLAVLAGGKKKGRNNAGPVVRSETATQGQADYATLQEAHRRFPGPDPEHGGVVVARNYRRDLSAWAGVPFEPREQATWDDADKARSLVDPCAIRSTHSGNIAPSGVGKSATIASTLAHPRHRWRGSYVLGDPKGELEAMSRRTREAMGQPVYAIGNGKDGINAMEVLNPESPEFELDVMTLVSRIFPEPAPGKTAEESEWTMWGQMVCCAMIAHMMIDPSFAEHERNLRCFKAGASCGEKELKQLLIGIGEYSPSKFARQNARSVTVEAEETWTGIYATVQASTRWLTVEALANMVSDSSFPLTDLCNKSITVFIQASPKALREAPGVGRVLYGSLFGTAYEANGFIKSRILFDVDEAYTLGRMGIMEIVRDLGRSYGITVRWWFQSVGQIEVLYREGTKAWYSSWAYMTFAGVSDLATAKQVSEMAGKYGATIRNTSANKGRSTQSASLSVSHNTGTSESETEVSRQLMWDHEVIQEMADNEVMVFTRGMRPIRAVQPLYFIDPETRVHLDKNPLDVQRLKWKEAQDDRELDLKLKDQDDGTSAVGPEGTGGAGFAGTEPMGAAPPGWGAIAA
jgi:type IV secretion system protein VirD4